ncbi:MAG: amino acid ABC transporter substrate-binding protein [Lachnospiraceae bacterium]|nr:amino acid ABC transporter substrate-binding protein [Lachnospiraceae bacterium]
MKKIKSIIALSLIAVMVFAIAGCSCSSSSSSTTTTSTTVVKNDDSTLVVGFDAEFPPYGFKDEKGNYTGFDLELAEAVANIIGMKVAYQPIDWDAKDAELNSGTIDCIWNGFTINGRENQYAWSEPYLNNEQVVVVKADSQINTNADLAGKTVEVQKESSAETALNSGNGAALKQTFGNLVTVADYNTALMDLESGAVDAVIMDSGVAEYKINSEKKSFRLLKEPIATEQYGVGFAKENTALRDKVNDALHQLAANGGMEQISTKWFGSNIVIIK